MKAYTVHKQKPGMLAAAEVYGLFMTTSQKLDQIKGKKPNAYRHTQFDRIPIEGT